MIYVGVIVVLLGRALLALVFAVAGAAKLVRRGDTFRAARDFGVPHAGAVGAAWLLPPIEVALAAGLLVGVAARPAAVAAAALLALFTAAIALALARAKRMECNCFGGLSGARVGLRSLIRNVGLAAVASLLIVFPAERHGVDSWSAGMSAAGVVAWSLGAALVLVTAAGVLFARELMRRYGRALQRLEALEGTGSTSRTGLPVGTAAPAFEVEGWSGGTVSLERLLEPGIPLAIVFLDASCVPCRAAVPAIAAAQRELRGRLQVAVLSRGVTAQTEAAWREHRLEQVGLDLTGEIGPRYEIIGAPAAVLVASDGRIAGPTVLGEGQITGLLRSGAAARDEREVEACVGAL